MEVESAVKGFKKLAITTMQAILRESRRYVLTWAALFIGMILKRPGTVLVMEAGSIHGVK